MKSIVTLRENPKKRPPPPSESEEDSDEAFEPQRSTKAKGAQRGKKAKSKRSPRNRSLLTTPTPEEIDEYVDRPRKKSSRPVETKAMKAQRLALAPLAPHRSAAFLHGREAHQETWWSHLLPQPLPRPCGGHGGMYYSSRRKLPQKTIYLALGNVRYVFVFVL